MKATIVSTLIFLPLIPLASATPIPQDGSSVEPWDGFSIGDACQNVELTDKYVLKGLCRNPHNDPSIHGTNVTLDLNECFANYLGTLNFVSDGNGGFGASCPECHLDDEKHKMICQCDIGNGQGNKTTIADLDKYNVISVEGYSAGMLMSCYKAPKK